MVPSSERTRRSSSLPQRLLVALAAAAVFVAVLLGYHAADRSHHQAVAERLAEDRRLATALAERAAPLLERQDLMRLSVLASVARDQADGRLLVLDRTGKVTIDTSLVLGDRTLGLLTSQQALQREVAREVGDPIQETIAPVRFGGDLIGEVRLQRDLVVPAATFDYGWFGLWLLGSLTIVAVAVALGYQWSMRVRAATAAVIRLSSGSPADLKIEGGSRELLGLGHALQEMERNLRAGSQQVADGYLAMATTLVDSLERRKLVAPGRSERLVKLAGRVAERLQLPDAERDQLETACRLADLGKAWVRAAILQKRGQLDEIERESLRQHPLRAAEHLERLPALRGVAAIVRHQCERYDGLGTPDRLRGDRIPLGARVLAIVSSFEALTDSSDRPLPWDAALERLHAARGEVFDPALLEAFAATVADAPPLANNDRAVAIVPAATTLFWPERPEDDDEDDDDDTVDELEVMLDDADRDDAEL